VAWGVWTIAFVMGVAGTVLVVLNGSPLLENTIFGSIFMTMGLTGALIAGRRPDNAIGWLLVGSTIAVAIAFAGGEAAIYGFETNPGSIPGARWLAWVSAWG
jgi:hypothetical protein